LLEPPPPEPTLITAALMRPARLGACEFGFVSSPVEPRPRLSEHQLDALAHIADRIELQ
jgi:hypothetical protein